MPNVRATAGLSKCYLSLFPTTLKKKKSSSESGSKRALRIWQCYYYWHIYRGHYAAVITLNSTSGNDSDSGSDNNTLHWSFSLISSRTFIRNFIMLLPVTCVQSCAFAFSGTRKMTYAFIPCQGEGSTPVYAHPTVFRLWVTFYLATVMSNHSWNNYCTKGQKNAGGKY